MSEQFQNLLEKLLKRVKWIRLTHKDMASHFQGLIQTLQ